MIAVHFEEILYFWFEELNKEDWFKLDSELDNLITERFERILQNAKDGELHYWRKTIRGRLAEIIVLDQFSRNIYRNSIESFSSDGMALILAQEALKIKDKDKLTAAERSFLYMPFMHSESLYIQENFSIKLFSEKGLEKRYKYAKEHYKTIKKFGRFPYRNKVLDRESTPEELSYLQQSH